MTLWLGSVYKVNDTSKELTKGNSPPVVDRELTAPPFIVATVVMEKEFFVKEACLTQPIA